MWENIENLHGLVYWKRKSKESRCSGENLSCLILDIDRDGLSSATNISIDNKMEISVVMQIGNVGSGHRAILYWRVHFRKLEWI
jgi:hypothetical protein